MPACPHHRPRLRSGRPTVLAALLALACVLPSAPALAQADGAPPRIAEVPDAPLAAVRVEGNRRVETEAILRRIDTKAGRPLDRATLRRDIQTLYELGFFEDVEVRLLTAREAGTEGPVVVFRVTEKPAIREVKYEGLDELSEDDLEEVVTIRPFSILDKRRVEDAARAIEEKYREKGFYLAEVDWRLDPVPEEAAVDVVFEVAERAKVQVKKIRFIGNDNVPEADLKAVMETREGGLLGFLTGAGTYQEEAFDRDLLRISAVYYDRGYINVKVGRPLVTLSPDRQYIYVAIPIEEGNQYTIGRMELSGDLLGQEDTLERLVAMQSGELFVRQKLGESIFALQDWFRDRGYAYANVTPLTNVDPEARTIDIVLDVAKGEKVRVERIEIVGNTRTRDKVIRREMRIAEGDVYDGSQIKVSRQRIWALGYFENVDVATRRGTGADQVVLEFTVKEKPTGTFQVGAGVSSGEGVLATVQVAHDNLFGRGQSLSLSGMFSSLRSIYQLQFMEPYFLDTRWTFSFGAFNTQQDYGGFRRNSTGGTLTWGYQLIDDLRLFLTYTGEQVDVAATDDTASRIREGLYGGGFTSSGKLTLTWDTRDNRLFPTDGSMQTASVEHAPSWLGSQNLFTRYTLISRWYRPLPFNLVGRVNAEVGYIAGSEYPLSERYFLGGVFSLRGYYLRSISPTVELPASSGPGAPTEPINVGGNKQVVLNFEIEFPLLTAIGIRGVVFYDMGNAYADDEAFFFDSQDDLPLGMFHSVGVGFRWFSPIGPLRFEWGFPLTRRPQDDFSKFEFTVGNFF